MKKLTKLYYAILFLLALGCIWSIWFFNTNTPITLTSNNVDDGYLEAEMVITDNAIQKTIHIFVHNDDIIVIGKRYYVNTDIFDASNHEVFVNHVEMTLAE